MLNEGSQMDGKGGPNAEENEMQSRGDRPVAPTVPAPDDLGKHRRLYRSLDLLYHKILAALLPHQPHGFAS